MLVDELLMTECPKILILNHLISMISDVTYKEVEAVRHAMLRGCRKCKNFLVLALKKCTKKQ